MGKYFGTKNDAYNLKFKEHEVFEGKLVVVDESDTPFIRLDKETEQVSFGVAYFRLYKEQRQLCMGLRLLPKAGCWTSDSVFIEVQRRVYSSNKRISEYEFKVEQVQ